MEPIRGSYSIQQYALSGVHQDMSGTHIIIGTSGGIRTRLVEGLTESFFNLLNGYNQVVPL
tara:strand:+ start:345 stop:527 length:183 start_codon:yes stop_codon:yes gene_type:complete